MRPKIYITSKIASNKSCLELNFVQKSLREHMSIFLMSGVRGLQRSVCLKSYNVQKHKKIHSLWGSTMPKIRIIWKKASNKSCSVLNFVQKSLLLYMSISPSCEARELQRFAMHIIFQNGKSLVPPSSTRWGDKHMLSQTFLYEIQFRKTFIWSFFYIMLIFGRINPKVNLISRFCTL